MNGDRWKDKHPAQIRVVRPNVAPSRLTTTDTTAPAISIYVVASATE